MEPAISDVSNSLPVRDRSPAISTFPVSGISGIGPTILLLAISWADLILESPVIRVVEAASPELEEVCVAAGGFFRERFLQTSRINAVMIKRINIVAPTLPPIMAFW